ncbi:MAG: hypothetical protein ACI8X5_003048 [Planctomycetota bacterium]|jgi:hypothetical protein
MRRGGRCLNFTATRRSVCPDQHAWLAHGANGSNHVVARRQQIDCTGHLHLFTEGDGDARLGSPTGKGLVTAPPGGDSHDLLPRPRPRLSANLDGL